MSLIEKEFVIQQCYKATVDESAIDEYYDKYSTDPNSDWAKECKDRFHRMFQAIVSSKDGLATVLEYMTIAAHEVCDDGVGDLIEERYEAMRYKNEDIEFAHILAHFADIFTQEDRDWLLSMIKEHAEVEAKVNPSMSDEGYECAGYFDLCIQTDALEKCFHVESSGWNIHSR